jgi:hypothetical protein
MNDKEFKNLDEAMMKSMKPLRDKKVSEGMLKGFSASVERKIQAGDAPAPAPVRRWAPMWVPTLAVMILASVVVLRSPVTTTQPVTFLSAPVELAQLVGTEEIQSDMELLKELGELTDEEEAAVLGDELDYDGAVESELSQYLRQSSIA